MGWVARVVGAAAFVAVAATFSPKETLASKWVAADVSTYLKLLHLLSFSLAYGTAAWVTFPAGVIMFKYLPRHQFGSLQSKLFPAYFTSMSGLCTICLASFGYLHPWKSASTPDKYQLGFLLASLALSLANSFVLTPITTAVMMIRHRLERDAMIGDEVGWSKNKQVAKTNPNLAAVNKRFGTIHGLSSLANVLCFGCLTMHSCFLASKINL